MTCRRIIVVGMLLTTVSACAKRDGAQDSATNASASPSPQTAAPAPPPALVTAAEFRDLRWIEGTWRGRMPDGQYFYERYTRLNDSTIQILHFPDSTLAASNEEDSITVRGGIMRHGEAVAIRFDSTGIDFAKPPRTTPQFSFAPASEGWTATIHGAANGQPVIYNMQRFTRR